MNLTQASRAMFVFNQLPVPTKSQIFNEMLNLGLRISYGTDTWHRHIKQRIKSKEVKGDLKRFYASLIQFTPNDVKTFLDAFSEKAENT